MEFSDFKDNPNDLIGKKVHVTNRYNSFIATITKVTKTSFKIDDSDSLYNLINGELRGKVSFDNTTAKLLTPEQETKLLLRYKQIKDKKDLKTLFENEFNNLTHEQVIAITNIIKPNNK